MARPSVARTWGSTEAERHLPFPCDPYLPDADEALYRAIDVDAPPPVVFRWLCQLRAAPYSYDLIDNLGRRSPRELTPGLENLEVGQRVQTIFELVEFEKDSHLTMVMRRGTRAFGQVALTYMVLPAENGGSRILVKFLVSYEQPPVVRSLARHLLPAGDLVMMRKQLRTLKKLAERSERP